WLQLGYLCILSILLLCLLCEPTCSRAAYHIGSAADHRGPQQRGASPSHHWSEHRSARPFIGPCAGGAYSAGASTVAAWAHPRYGPMSRLQRPSGWGSIGALYASPIAIGAAAVRAEVQNQSNDYPEPSPPGHSYGRRPCQHVHERRKWEEDDPEQR